MITSPERNRRKRHRMSVWEGKGNKCARNAALAGQERISTEYGVCPSVGFWNRKCGSNLPVILKVGDQRENTGIHQTPVPSAPQR
jgi:hypothetical protein